MLGAFRVKYKLKTRNPKERPTHFSIGITEKNGRRKRINISAGEYHATTFIYKFTKPKILLGLPFGAYDLEWTACMFVFKAGIGHPEGEIQLGRNRFDETYSH